jgi:hypothetical protein
MHKCPVFVVCQNSLFKSSTDFEKAFKLWIAVVFNHQLVGYTV